MTKRTYERSSKEFSQKSDYDKDKKIHFKYNKGKKSEFIEDINNNNNKLSFNNNKITNIMLSNNDDEQKKSSDKKLTFIEVCAGAGGLSKGFIDCGFEALLLNDTDKYCVETLKLNHPKINIIKGSMVDLDLEKYKEQKIDVLMGGVPCQSFSQAGKRKGIQDDRGKLILHFIEMINILNPNVFLIENVHGLVTHENGSTLKMIISEINKIDKYTINYKVLNANDYSVPQNRKRLIIVGINHSINKTFNFPKEHEYKPVLSDVLTNCPKSDGAVYNTEKKKLFTMIPEGGCWINLPEDLQKSYMGKSYESGGGKRGILKRLDMKKPCLTLLTTPSQKQTERCHPTETRPLQILEYARIQTFPDDYKFAGSLNQKYKQIGNAVPVKLSEAIAKEIYKLLKTNYTSLVAQNQ